MWVVANNVSRGQLAMDRARTTILDGRHDLEHGWHGFSLKPGSCNVE